jgi:hypothetical protein
MRGGLVHEKNTTGAQRGQVSVTIAFSEMLKINLQRWKGDQAMKRISSRWIWFSKYVFPVFWFGFLGFSVVMILVTENSEGAWPFFLIIVPILMGVFGYFMMKKMVWDLADEVSDAGDSLIVRFGKEEEQILLSNIVNVSYSYMMSPARVTLMLREAARFGSEVSFAPPQRFSFNPFAKSPVILDLIQRVDAARRASK